MNSIERKVMLGFAGTLLLLGVMAAATYLSSRSFIAKSARFREIQAVMARVDAMRHQLSVAQAGQRDFMISGRESDLEAFQDGLFSLNAGLKELRAMVKDADQVERLAALEPLLVRKIELLKSALAVRNRQGLAAATRHLGRQDDQGVTKAVEDLVGAFRAREEELFKEQAAEAEREAGDLRRTVAVGIACNLALFALVYLLVHGEMKRRQAAERELEKQSGLLASVLRHMGDGVQAVDAQGRFLVSNPAAKQLLGQAPERLAPEAFGEKLGLFHGDRSSPLAYQELPLVRALQGRDTDALELYIKSARVPQGAFVSAFGRPLRGPDQGIIGAIAVYRNISEQKNGEMALLQSNAKLTDLVETLQQQNEDISALSDLVETLQACNSADEVGQASAAVMSVLFRGSHGALYAMSQDKANVERLRTWGGREEGQAQAFPLERCWSFRRNQPNFSNADHPGKRCPHFGEEAPSEALCIPLAAHGEALGLLTVCSVHGKERAVVASRQKLGTMIGEQIGLALANLRLREGLKNQSIHDPLTGLFNRRYMEESFEQELAQASRAQSPLCLAMLDVDHFKKFNDEFGHDAGDLVLKEISKVLKETLRRGDIVCRFGGEELAVLMPHSPAGQARLRMDAIRVKISELKLFHLDRRLPPLTVSIGIGVYPEDGRAVSELMRRADEALYAAKQGGRNRVMMGPNWDQQGSEAA